MIFIGTSVYNSDISCLMNRVKPEQMILFRVYENKSDDRRKEVVLFHFIYRNGTSINYVDKQRGREVAFKNILAGHQYCFKSPLYLPNFL